MIGEKVQAGRNVAKQWRNEKKLMRLGDFSRAPNEFPIRKSCNRHEARTENTVGRKDTHHGTSHAVRGC